MAKQDVIGSRNRRYPEPGRHGHLCTDKTGNHHPQTRLCLSATLNILGEEDPRVLRHAYLNCFPDRPRNLIDKAIIKTSNDELPTNLLSIEYEKIDEVPFDFERMSVVVRKHKTDKRR